MLGPAAINLLSFYYPLGNTPPISWAQDFPPGTTVNILSLGCGDVRNILFTSHTVQDDAKMDITCCDIESTVIARNILFLTLLLDQQDESRFKSIWDIYYHIRISEQTLELLETHASKLNDLAKSLEAWHDGPYGKCFLICDTTTLREVRRVWQAFMKSVKGKARKSRFEGRMKDSADYQKTRIGEDAVALTSFRNLTPLLPNSAPGLSDIYRAFWKDGTTDATSGPLKTPILNPTFVSHSIYSALLHYSTDPMFGFHLASAYAPVISGHRSPQASPPTSSLHTHLLGMRKRVSGPDEILLHYVELLIQLAYLRIIPCKHLSNDRKLEV